MFPLPYNSLESLRKLNEGVYEGLLHNSVESLIKLKGGVYKGIYIYIRLLSVDCAWIRNETILLIQVFNKIRLLREIYQTFN